MKKTIIAVLSLLMAICIVSCNGEVNSKGDSEPAYLCFTAKEAGAEVKLKAVGSPYQITLEYSNNATSWSDYTVGTPITLTKAGDKVYFRAKTFHNYFSKSYENYYQFELGDKKVAASGNIMSLMDSECEDTAVPNSAFRCLFKDCTSLTTAPALPATNLYMFCYSNMFENCTSLTTAPALPAMELAVSCYEEMFKGCKALTTLTPSYVEGKNIVLPATTLVDDCYQMMFMDCTSLEFTTDSSGANLLFKSIADSENDIKKYASSMFMLYSNPEANKDYYWKVKAK